MSTCKWGEHDDDDRCLLTCLLGERARGVHVEIDSCFSVSLHNIWTSLSCTVDDHVRLKHSEHSGFRSSPEVQPITKDIQCLCLWTWTRLSVENYLFKIINIFKPETGSLCSTVVVLTAVPYTLAVVLWRRPRLWGHSVGGEAWLSCNRSR